MKIVFELPEGNKGLVGTWRHAKRAIAFIRKKFPEEMRKKLDKLDIWDEEFQKYITPKVSDNISKLEFDLVELAMECDIKEEK